MVKRESSRGVIIKDNFIYAMYRRRIDEQGNLKEYYVIPGGGRNTNETLEEAIIREMKEELSIDIKIKGYLGKEENDNAIANFFSCEIVNGIPKLGGEELEKCSESNYYEVRLIPIENLDKINIFAKNMILKACKEEYTTYKD